MYCQQKASETLQYIGYLERYPNFLISLSPTDSIFNNFHQIFWLGEISQIIENCVIRN